MAENDKITSKELQRRNNAQMRANDSERRKRDKYRDKRSSRQKFRDRTATSTGILGIVFAIILIAVLIRIFTGSTNIPTFTGFLEMLQDVPNVQIPFLSTVTTNILVEPWAILDGLRVFLRTILNVVDVVIFLINGLLSVATYVVYFFRWLFIG